MKMAAHPKPTYVIDGANFSNFAGFVEECNRAFIRGFGGEWNGNWNAFHDYFSWTDGEYVLVWKGIDRAEETLGEVDRDIVLDIIREQPHVELRLE